MKAAVCKVKRIAADVARPAAALVDKDARFPHEAIAALREENLLAAAIPREFGGLGCSVTEVSEMCTLLGQACASTAMIFAMHHIQVKCLVRHGVSVPFFRDYLREAADRQLLIASGTSEVGVGGQIRSSNAAIDWTGTHFKLQKNCSTVSYAEEADAILITARRSPDANPGDQVLALLRTQDYELKRIGEWDTLGMRGTCSPPFTVTAHADGEQILPDPFRCIAGQTMVPCSHILWSSVWLGIAADAVSTARSLTRQTAKQRPETVPFGSAHLVKAVSNLQLMAAYIHAAVQEYEGMKAQPCNESLLAATSYALRINNLKLASSQLAVQICLECMGACGLMGYINNSEFSIGRQLRDALGAPLMIANDRISATNASLLLVLNDEELE
jgi:acyl-CoA dehydrogenase